MSYFDGIYNGPPPTKPSEYPINTTPREAESLLSPKWSYEPTFMNYPKEGIQLDSRAQVKADLTAMAIGLSHFLSGFESHLSATKLLEQIDAKGSEAWCEVRWMNDLRQFIQANPEPKRSRGRLFRRT